MTRILGIDFSGAKDAGRRIWIAEARKTDGPLHIEACFPAARLPESGLPRGLALPALARHILREENTVAGCDFPFSLPLPLLKARSWRAFLRAFPRRFPDPIAFHDRCHRATGGIELKRRTDKEDRTPFNSYNLRLYRQTWWGVSRLLAPLVESNAAIVRPQMDFLPGKPILIEVCAASTLIHLDCHPPYKGKTLAHRRARAAILDRLIEEEYLARLSPSVRASLLENPGGDALDAVIGAIAANRAAIDVEGDPIDRLEGKVYFML